MSSLGFVPGKELIWFCQAGGNYDSIDMIHTRYYLSIDIIRRIILTHFNSDVTLVMCIDNLIKDNFADIEIEKSIPNCSRSTIKEFFGADGDRLPSFSTNTNSKIQIQYRTRKASDYIKKLLSQGMISHPIITLYTADYIKEKTTSEQPKHDFISEKQCEPNESILKSPWELGRHHSKNEYIKMASAVLNSKFDLCIGEINQDLSDHADEIVQSQDFHYDDLYQTWFLNIGGFKTDGHEMSQTSDNVRNIDDFRNKYGIKIRYLFLLHPWSSIIDLNDDTIRKVLDYQNSIIKYLKNMETKLNKIEGMPNLHGYTKFNEHDVTFHKHFSRIKQQIHLAFCDSIDTRTVLEHIRDLTSITMEYTDGDEMPNINLIKNVNSYISRTIDMFGL